MQVIRAWLVPWVIGVLVVGLVDHLSPPPSIQPFQLVWLICVLATSWVAVYVIRMLLNPRN